ncbi:MAG TPA: PDZ domain-containing protein, partial [Terriglobus sp.]
ELLSVGGVAINSQADLQKAVDAHKAGDTVELVFKRRGVEVKSNAVVADDPTLEILPVESTGGTLTAEQKAFREAWLGSKVK